MVMSETPRKATITILLSEYTELTQLRTERDSLAADNAKLRHVIAKLFNPDSGVPDYAHNSIGVITGYSFSAGSRMEEDLKEALSTPPSDALT